jgi:hypothetical protein
MLPESMSPSVSLIEIVPTPELLVLNVDVNTSVPSKLLCSPIPDVETAEPPPIVTVPVHIFVAGAPHAKSMAPAFARGTNKEMASRQIPTNSVCMIALNIWELLRDLLYKISVALQASAGPNPLLYGIRFLSRAKSIPSSGSRNRNRNFRILQIRRLFFFR